MGSITADMRGRHTLDLIGDARRLASVGTFFITIGWIGLIYALVNIIGMEFLIDFGGLGRIVSEMYFRYEIPAMYAAILLIVAVSWLVLGALGWLETWLRPR